jgi:hypothetical protein
MACWLQPAAGTYLAADSGGRAKKPEPPKLINWTVYKIANKRVWLGDIEAPDEGAALEKAPKNSRCRLTG